MVECMHVSAGQLNTKQCLKHLGINDTIGCQLVVSFSMHCHMQVDEAVRFGMLFSTNTELGPSRL